MWLLDLLCFLLVSAAANALSVDPTSSDSVKSAASTIAKGIMGQYSGGSSGGIPGLFSIPYNFWSDAAIWDGMVDYWFLTGDSSYNSVVGNALQFQVGDGKDYMPANQTKAEGNDDQSTWALAALTAAERNFTFQSSTASSWSVLATNIFNEQAARWDVSTCAGGLRWQIFPFNNGYNYKNSISNANFFQIAARLAHFTGNSTYSDWAEKTFDWLQNVGFLTAQGALYDGADTTLNCTEVNKIEWTMYAGVLLAGSASMYNVTNGNATWHQRLTTLLSNIQTTFFLDGVMIEVACEKTNNCDTDQRFFKGVLARDLARTAVMAPFTASAIIPLLQSTAKTAVQVGCTNSNGTCSLGWTGTGNGQTDVGSTFSVMEVVLGNLVTEEKGLQTQNGTVGQGSTNSTTGAGSAPTKSSAMSLVCPTVMIWGVLLIMPILMSLM